MIAVADGSTKVDPGRIGRMAVVDEFNARTLADALRSIAGVLADHADAIDSLDLSTDSAARVGDGTDAGSAGRTWPEGFPTDDLPANDVLVDEAGPGAASGTGVGSDAARTLALAVEAANAAKDLSTLTTRMSSAATTAAVGQGGKVIGYLLRALSEMASTTDSIDAERFALALEIAAELAAAATIDDKDHGAPGDGIRGDDDNVGDVSDSRGVVGTGGAASVIAAASVGALRAVDQNMSLVEVIIAAADEGLDELESGVATNERLAAAGVVDAAGAVFLLVLDSFAAIASGDPLPEPPVVDEDGAPDTGTVFRIGCVAVPLGPEASGQAVQGRAGDHGHWLETCAWLESSLTELGVVVSFKVASATCDVEVLTNDPGRTIESLCTVARPTELLIRVDRVSDTDEGPHAVSVADGPVS